MKTIIKNHSLYRISILIICAVSTLFAYTQEYEPILKEGRMWKYHLTSIEEGETEGQDLVTDTIISYIEEGDTIITNKKYAMLSMIRPNGTRKYHAAFREENGCVYMVEKDKAVEQLHITYIPSLFQSLSDDPPLFEFNEPIITSTEIIQARNRTYKRIRYRTIANEKDTIDIGIAVEGIGYINKGLLLSGSYNEPTCIYCTRFTFDSCWENGVCIFDNNDFLQPTIDNRITNPYFEGKMSVTNSTFDLTGRRICNEPKPGIYIRGGKKFIIR